MSGNADPSAGQTPFRRVHLGLEPLPSDEKPGVSYAVVRIKSHVSLQAKDAVWICTVGKLNRRRWTSNQI